MKYLIIVLVIVLLVGCAAKDTLPEGATLIEEVSRQWVVFELNGQLFLYMRSYGMGAITRLDYWD